MARCTIRIKPYHSFQTREVARRTFEHDIRDGAFVEQILRQLRQVDGHLRFIMPFDHQWFAVRHTRHPTEFFLNHARERRIVDIWYKRVVDWNIMDEHPCEVAIHWRSPRLLLILLQHGAGLYWRRGREWTDYSGDPFFEKLVMLVYKKILLCLHSGNISEEQEKKDDLENHPEIGELMKCARYIARASPQLSNIPQSLTSRPPLRDLSIRTSGPATLRHACRLVIRRRLDYNWQLPDGIYTLPLPERVKHFLNLLEDG